MSQCDFFEHPNKPRAHAKKPFDGKVALHVVIEKEMEIRGESFVRSPVTDEHGYFGKGRQHQRDIGLIMLLHRFSIKDMDEIFKNIGIGVRNALEWFLASRLSPFQFP